MHLEQHQACHSIQMSGSRYHYHLPLEINKAQDMLLGLGRAACGSGTPRPCGWVPAGVGRAVGAP